MFGCWKRRRAEKRALLEQVKHDAYIERLLNSAHGFCGTRHTGEGPFLSIEEVRSLIWKEVKSRTGT